MELSWSTFALEMINFLILVWILKHFLYQPVLDVIARRQSGIEKTLGDARSLQATAEDLKQQYEDRLANWEQERQKAREAMARALETERAAKLSELQTTLAQEREKSRVADARRQSDATRQIEETALTQAAHFASHLLKLAAGPETEERLVELMIEGLSQLPEDITNDLRTGVGKPPQSIDVMSAFKLSQDQRKRLQQALVKVTGPDIPLLFGQKSELLAGVRITIGARVLGANLLDELKGFAELSHDADRIKRI